MVAMALFLAASCVEPLSSDPCDGQVIAFRATADAATKAAEVTTENITEFTCSAYMPGTTSSPYFSLVQYTGSGSPKRFDAATDYYWPEAGLDFYAHSPSSSAQLTRSNFRTFTVTPSADHNAQMDLVVACAPGRTRSADGASGTALNFRHAESRITVKVKNTNADLKFRVTGWKVGYLATSGTYTHPAGLSTSGSGILPQSAWSGNTTFSASNTYTSDFTSSPVSVAASTTTPVSLAGEMVLVPQVTTAATAYDSFIGGAPVNGSYVAVEIEIMANDAYSTVVVSKTWAAWPVRLNWEPGRQYTYTVDLCGGGYYLTNQGGDAGLDPLLENGFAEFGEIVVDPWNVRNDIGLSFVTDLSYCNTDGTYNTYRSTANSYVVGNVGWYAIPLVYGNGIKGGAVNSAAYTRQGSTYTADFVNHLGNTLTSPYIESNAGCTAASAALLWQTSPGMIQDVQILGGTPCRYLLFRVDDIPATNGDAVLVLYDGSGTVIWSWMVWVTADAIGPDPTTNHAGTVYQLMNENFGAIWNGASRDAASGARYVAPHYQWGRKDPMCPPAAYNSGSNMTLYDVTGSTYTGFGGYGVDADSDAGGTVRSVANAIRMPNKFFLEYDNTSYNWNNLTWFNNFWNAAETASGSSSNNQASVVKTIYDPCPPGWVMPAPQAWTGFTTTGSNTTDSSQWNIVGSFTNGFFFKCSSSDASGAWYPASGYRHRASGALTSVGSYGYYWSAAPYSQAYARLLGFSSGLVYPLSTHYRAYGFAVRPAQEP